MLRYGFVLTVNATSTPVVAGTFVVPASPKLALVYFSVDGNVVVAGESYNAPTVARLLGSGNQATGEVLDFTGVLGTAITENRGIVLATNEQSFRGCWELPQGVSTLSIDATFSTGGLPAAPYDSVSARINLIFET